MREKSTRIEQDFMLDIEELGETPPDFSICLECPRVLDCLEIRCAYRANALDAFPRFGCYLMLRVYPLQCLWLTGAIQKIAIRGGGG